MRHGRGGLPFFDLDVRGLLAILALVGAFALAFYQLSKGRAQGGDIPAWAATMVGSIAGFYFGSRGGTPPSTGGNGGGTASVHVEARQGGG